jgi:superfamily II DNA or RNA helicase
MDELQYSKEYPTLYALSGGFAIERENQWIRVLKCGSTWHIANRKAGALTYFPKKPVFEHVIVLQKESFPNKADLYILDAQFVQFLKQKGLGQYYIEEEGGTEWFSAECPESYLNLSLEFLQQKNLPILTVLTYDPFPIRDIVPTDQEEKPITLVSKFWSVFLPNKQPRRIQEELWHKVSVIIQETRQSLYKGIVQWPTGVGKTIAILIKIVLLKEYFTSKGQLYRGLFVSPKNDILNTLLQHFAKLSQFGIKVYDGSNAQFSSLTVSPNHHCLVLACHAALVQDEGMERLPPMGHVHYDEVHRITGDLYFQQLTQKMTEWGTLFLTGTSATPKTASPDQHRKLAELFGDPLPIISKCNVDEAVQEGWIAKPRFLIRILEAKKDRAAILDAYVDCCVELVVQKDRGGKSIFYIESSIQEVEYAVAKARERYPHMHFYAAVDSERTDEAFLRAPVNEIPHVLFACQRYREGSDIPGLELTGKLIGNTTAAHNLIQISGRGLRIDYADKEGWCLLAKPCEAGATVEDVLDSIVLEIIDYLGKMNVSMGNKDIRTLVRTYFGELKIEGSSCSVEETIERVQAAYARTQFAKRTPRENFTLIQGYNKELGLQSKTEYEESRARHPRYVEAPREYFAAVWTNWYAFLGVDTSSYPPTKQAFLDTIKNRGIQTWEQYKAQKAVDLPQNPSEMYSDWTNPDKEFGIEEEIIW